MAASATTATAFRIARLSLNSPSLPSHFFRPIVSPSTSSALKRSPTSVLVSCLISGVDGGGVSDDFVSTRNSGFDREFSVIANMLKRIEPLDTSIISKGVSDSAKDSMKQTISTMLGLLPSDQFSVTVRVSKHPLNRLLVSSVITGYTLWNAEYRISLKRNFDLSPDSSKQMNSCKEESDTMEVNNLACGDGCCEVEDCGDDLDRIKSLDIGDLSPEALDYIQQLESELSTAKHELHAQKKENMQIEYIRKGNNDLLEYLRSLDAEMVTELSHPSSLEVEEVIKQLVENILHNFFQEGNSSNKKMGDSATECHKNGINEICDAVDTSRDYLAKLLFWCMLLGHHLRGLENRVHLSCAVGLL